MKLSIKYILVVLCLAILTNMFILPVVSASDVQTLGSIPQGSSILLKQNCVNTTYVNITSISVHALTETRELLTNILSMNLVTNGYQTYNFSNTSLPGEYIVTGICDENGIAKAWSYSFTSGNSFGIPEILVYLFLFLLLSSITYYSFKLTISNSMVKDELNGSSMYQLKKRNELQFYIQVMKKKMWILGLFGIYISITLLISLLFSLTGSLGLIDIFMILGNIVNVMLWMSIPFTIFWIAYIIFIFAKSTKDAMQYQFGKLAGR